LITLDFVQVGAHGLGTFPGVFYFEADIFCGSSRVTLFLAFLVQVLQEQMILAYALKGMYEQVVESETFEG